jgi:hypothetical protein
MYQHQRMNVGRHLRMVAADPMQQLCPFLLSLGARVVEEGKGQRLKVTKARSLIMIQKSGKQPRVKLLDRLEARAWRYRTLPGRHLDGVEAFSWRHRQRIGPDFLRRHKRERSKDKLGTTDAFLQALGEKPVVFLTEVLQVSVIQAEVLALALWDLESLQSSIG